MRPLRAAAVALVLAVLLGAPLTAVAATLDDYASRVDGVLARVRAAGADVTAEEARSIFEAVATDLPSGETVDSADGGVVTDTSVLGAVAKRLADARTPAERADAARDLETHLASLSLALGEEGAGVAPDRAVLDGLLEEQVVDTRSGMLAEKIREIVNAVLNQLMRWRGVIGERGGSGERIAMAVGIGIVALVLGFTAWRVFLALRRRIAAKDVAAPKDAAPVVAAAEGLPPDALSFAESLAEEGRSREAVRALFGGAARALVERGVLRSTRTRTNAELLAEVTAGAPAVRPPLRELSDAFELAWYGHVEPGDSGFAAARSAYRRTLEAAGEGAR